MRKQSGSDKSFYDNIKNMSKEGRHFLIWLLYRFIEIEVEQPEEDIDEDYIFECSEMIDALTPDDERIPKEEVERKLAEFKKKIQEKSGC